VVLFKLATNGLVGGSSICGTSLVSEFGADSSATWLKYLAVAKPRFGNSNCSDKSSVLVETNKDTKGSLKLVVELNLTTKVNNLLYREGIGVLRSGVEDTREGGAALLGAVGITLLFDEKTLFT
jgi:hypothetical protein